MSLDDEVAASEEASSYEEKTAANTSEADDQIRRTLADVYTFVRAAEINKTISSFSLDHYIDEAKRRIKDDRVLRSASNPSKGTGTRPSQLDALTKLEETFNKVYDQAKEMADKASVNNGGTK